MKKNIRLHALSITLLALATACTSQQPDRPSANPGATNSPLLTTALRPFAQPLVPVSIDGQVYHFILDTGAPYSFIDNRTAQKLSKALPPDQVPEYFRNYIGQLGSLGTDIEPDQVTYWQPRPFMIGTQAVQGSVPWVGMDFSMLELSYGSHVDGLLGANAFRQLNWGMDNLAHTLTVWSQPPSTAGYAHCAPYADAFGEGPDVTIQLANGNGGPMRIDTGATYENVSTAMLAALREQGASVQEIGQSTRLSATGVYQATNYLVDGLHFDGKPMGRLRVYESSGSNTLGMSFLSRLDSYVFIPSEMLFCYNARQITRDDAKPLRWVELSAKDGRLRIGVANTLPESLPGELATDDLLMAVNGQTVDVREIEAIRRELANTPAGALTLRIERQGKLINIKL